MNDFVGEHLSTTEFSVIARKGYPLSNCTSLSELQNAKWYLPTASTGYYSKLEGIISPNKNNKKSSIIFGDSTTIAEQLILNEDYLFIGPKSMFLVPQIKDLICTIPIKEQLPEGVYSLIYSRTQKLTPVAATLMDDL